MKKLFSTAMVALATIATSAPVMAHQGDVSLYGDYDVWSFNFGADSGLPPIGQSYRGPGVIYTSEVGDFGADNTDGVNNFWNYSQGSSNGQAYDARHLTSGNFSVTAPLYHNETATKLSGYISSDGSTPITITTAVYGFGLTTGHAYVYTEQGQTAAVLQGISGVSTATPSVSYTWDEASTGITYNVQEYFVESQVADSMSFELTGGQVNAMQLTPIPPHPIPEPGAVALLGIGGLAGLVMRKKQYSAQA